jgi:putative aminopeptidase FrvX
MLQISSFLKDLISAPGLSGYEDPAAKIIEDAWRPFVHEIKRGNLGSLQAFQPGNGVEPRPSVMIATHMDAIGLMVTDVTHGFLRLTSVGGVDARVLPGTPVTVHATKAGKTTPLPGVVIQPPAHLLPPEMRDGGPIPLRNLFVDTGLNTARIDQLVQVGDLISLDQAPLELTGETLAGHSLDNRASVAALTLCLEQLQARPHAWDVWAVATTQEEVGAVGAYASTFSLHPTIALIVDVTFGKGPGASDWNTFPLDKGPTIVAGANIHPFLHREIKKLADKLEIPYAVEYSPTHTGTDGMATQVSGEGVPTVVLGIPLRYMHTQVEMVAIKDIQRTGRLMAEFIAYLEPNFLDKFHWDE